MLKQFIQYVLALVYPLFKSVLPYELYAYLAVGAANTALNIFLFALWFQCILPLPGFFVSGCLIPSYTISLVLAFLATIPTGFWLAKHFAFHQNKGTGGQTGKQLGKYFIVVLQGLFTDYLLLVSLITFLGLHPTVAKICSTVLVLSLNYLLQKHYTFKKMTA